MIDEQVGHLGKGAWPYERRYPCYRGGAECPPVLDLIRHEGHVLRCPFCARQRAIAARRLSRRADPLPGHPDADPAAPEPAGATRHDGRGRSPLWPLAVTVAAASVIVAGLWWCFPPATPPSRAYAGATVVDWGLSTEALPARRGAAMRVVYSGQGYQLRPRIATGRTHGWLYQIDSRGAWLLMPLTAQPDGTLGGSYEDKFDDNEGGVEVFATILSGADVPALNVPKGPAPWLTARERQRLQELAKGAGNEDEITRLLAGALGRHGWSGTADDLRVQRLEHLPQ